MVPSLVLSTCIFVPLLLDHTSQSAGSMKPYCVVLYPEPLVNSLSYPRTTCFFLRASTADGAIQTASVDHPQWRVIGIEPSHLFAACYDSTFASYTVQ
jgi:hypothetical protein